MHNLMVCSGGSFLYDVVIHDVFDLFVKRLTNELHVQQSILFILTAVGFQETLLLQNTVKV